MKKILIAVLDLGTECFATPFFVDHQIHATRQFIQECGNPDSEISKHAKDYELWQLATFETDNGQITPDQQRILRAIDHTKG